MFSSIIRQRLHNRLPEDSGEWVPVPLRFKRLPPAAKPGQHKLWSLSAALAFVQLMLLAPAVWVFLEYFKEKDLPALVAVATWIGLATSIAAGAYIAQRYWLNAPNTTRLLMRGQVWWCVLLLIPCYGWGALFLLGFPCVFGTYFGASIGALMGQRQGARS